MCALIVLVNVEVQWQVIPVFNSAVKETSLVISSIGSITDRTNKCALLGIANIRVLDCKQTFFYIKCNLYSIMAGVDSAMTALIQKHTIPHVH